MAATTTTFELVAIDGKGMGLRATEPIPKGTRIISDKPLIIFEYDDESCTMKEYLGVIGLKLTKLREKYRAAYRAFMSLANIYTTGDEKLELKEAGIARTSSILLSINPHRHGVFENAARLNHSCSPNAYYHWNETIGRLTVHAVRDINKGEEITIHYHLVLESLVARQQRHMLAFRFVCQCGVCTAPVADRLHRDNLLAVLRKHLDIFDSGEIDELKHIDSDLALRHCREITAVAEAAGMANSIVSDSLWEAAITAIFNGDQARAIVFAKRSHEARIVLEGSDGDSVTKLAKFIKSPANHKDYGISTAWKSKPQDIPTDLSQNEFESWLWRTSTETFRALKAALRPCLGDFNDTELYPLFHQLPHTSSTDPRFWYHDTKDKRLTAIRFWCLMGEVVQCDISHGVKLIVKDKAGVKFPIWFHTPRLGMELGLGLLKEGNAICINCAEYCEMPGGIRGIVQRQSGLTKVGFLMSMPHVCFVLTFSFQIFDLSLEKLLDLNKTVQEYAMENDACEKKCLGCDKTSGNLKAHCSQCKMMYFCDKVSDTSDGVLCSRLT